MALSARQKRADQKRIQTNRNINEVKSYKGASVEVICAAGHPEMASHSRYDKKGRVVAVLWICRHPGCQNRFEVNPKKQREERYL